MSTLPFDFDHILRKSNLRVQGDNGLAAMAMILREHGIHADVIHRDARLIKCSAFGNIDYVKEQRQSALSVGGRLISLDNDTDWDQILERFYFKQTKAFKAIRGSGQSQRYCSYQCYFLNEAVALDNQTLLQKSQIVPQKKMETLIRLVEESLGQNYPLPRRRATDKPGDFEKNMGEHSIEDEADITFMDQEGMEALKKLEYQRKDIYLDIAAYIEKNSKQKVELLVKPILIRTEGEKDTIWHGYRLGVRFVKSGRILGLTTPGTWNEPRPDEIKSEGKTQPLLVGASQAVNIKSERDISWLDGEDSWIQASPAIKRFMLLDQIGMSLGDKQHNPKRKM